MGTTLSFIGHFSCGWRGERRCKYWSNMHFGNRFRVFHHSLETAGWFTDLLVTVWITNSLRLKSATTYEYIVSWQQSFNYSPWTRRSCSCRKLAKLGSWRIFSGSARHTCKEPSVTSLRETTEYDLFRPNFGVLFGDLFGVLLGDRFGVRFGVNAFGVNIFNFSISESFSEAILSDWLTVCLSACLFELLTWTIFITVFPVRTLVF